MTYTSELSKEQCLRRLQAHVGGGFWSRGEEGTISAKVRGDRFRLFAWGPANVRNSFAPFFYGRLEEADGKTRIGGSFRLHPLVRGFMAVWFGGLLFMAFAFASLPVSSPGHAARRSSLEFLGPLGMAGAGALFLRFGHWLARHQMEAIRGFLERELKAERADVAGKSGEKGNRQTANMEHRTSNTGH